MSSCGDAGGLSGSGDGDSGGCDEGCGGGGGGGDIVRFPTTAIPETIKVLPRQSV